MRLQEAALRHSRGVQRLVGGSITVERSAPSTTNEMVLDEMEPAPEATMVCGVVQSTRRSPCRSLRNRPLKFSNTEVSTGMKKVWVPGGQRLRETVLAGVLALHVETRLENGALATSSAAEDRIEQGRVIVRALNHLTTAAVTQRQLGNPVLAWHQSERSSDDVQLHLEHEMLDEVDARNDARLLASSTEHVGRESGDKSASGRSIHVTATHHLTSRESLSPHHTANTAIHACLGHATRHSSIGHTGGFGRTSVAARESTVTVGRHDREVAKLTNEGAELFF